MGLRTYGYVSTYMISQCQTWSMYPLIINVNNLLRLPRSRKFQYDSATPTHGPVSVTDLSFDLKF